MKYQYSIYVEEVSGYKHFKFTTDLYGIEQIFYDMAAVAEAYYLYPLKNILLGESDYEETGGNVCSLDIKRDFAEVYVEFAKRS